MPELGIDVLLLLSFLVFMTIGPAVSFIVNKMVCDWFGTIFVAMILLGGIQLEAMIVVMNHTSGHDGRTLIQII